MDFKEDMFVLWLGDIIYIKPNMSYEFSNDFLTVECIFTNISFMWLMDNKMGIMLVWKILYCAWKNNFTFRNCTDRYYILSDQMQICLNKFLRYEW